MAVSREQAVLEILLELGDTLKGFDQLQREYSSTIQKLNVATDKADIDQLTRDAKDARDAMERLASKGQQQLKKLADAGQIATTEYKQLRQSVDLLEKEIAQADRELAQFNRRGDDVGRLTAGVGRLRAAWESVGAVVAAIGLARLLREAVVAANEKQAAMAQLNAVLKSTENVVGLTADELARMADEFEDLTLYSAEQVIAAENVLLTYTQIGKETFPRATQAALDMATALGEDTTAAAERVGRAIGYPTRATAALSQQGFVFTAQQIEQIRVLEESGRMAEAQAIILEELELAYKGSAEAARNTFGGAMEDARQAAGDFLETVGSQGLNKELAVLSRLFSDNKGSATGFAVAIGQTLGFLVSLAGRLIQAFELARAGVAGSFTLILAGARALAGGLSAIFGGVERLIQGLVNRLADLIPETDLPGKLDDALRSFASSMRSGLEAGRAEAAQKRQEILRELDLLIAGFADTARDRFDAAKGIGEDLARIRAELEALGVAAGGPLAASLDESGSALEAFRQELFGNSEALRLNADRIVELVQSLGGLGAATASQRKVIGAEVQKLIDGFDLINERPPAALAALARAMGITAKAVAKEADSATAALKGLIEAADEAARLPVARFRADLDLDEGDITARLAEVQGKLEAMRSGLTLDPAEETALLAEEARLLTDLDRAQGAWEESIVETNRAQREQAGLSAEHIQLLREQGLLADELADGLGLTAEQLKIANAGFRVAGDGLGGLVESGTEAAQVTLPALDQAQLDATRSSGELGASFEAMADRLLVTAGNAELMGKGLADAGEKGAEGQKKAAEETKTAAEQVKEQETEVRKLIAALRDLDKVQKEVLPAGGELWKAYTAEMRGAVEACSELRSCQGGG